MTVSCDICGRDDVFAVIMLEGAKMVACRGCAKGGKLLYRLDDEPDEAPQQRMHAKPIFEEEIEVVEGYGKRIKEARERAGMRIEELARRINEKTSYMTSIEQERLVLTIPVAKKVETALGITLVGKVREELAPSPNGTGKFAGLTLSDVTVEKKRKGDNGS